MSGGGTGVGVGFGGACAGQGLGCGWTCIAVVRCADIGLDEVSIVLWNVADPGGGGASVDLGRIVRWLCTGVPGVAVGVGDSRLYFTWPNVNGAAKYIATVARMIRVIIKRPCLD